MVKAFGQMVQSPLPPSPLAKELHIHLCEYYLRETYFYQNFCKNDFTTHQLTNTTIVFQLVPTKVWYQTDFQVLILIDDFVDISYYLTVEPVKHPYQILIIQKQVQ